MELEGDSRDWEDGSVVKYLPHMHEDLSSNSRTHIKLDMVMYPQLLDSNMGA